MEQTHYWQRPRELPKAEFAAVVVDFRQCFPAFQQAGMELVGPDGMGEPTITDELVEFTDELVEFNEQVSKLKQPFVFERIISHRTKSNSTDMAGDSKLVKCKYKTGEFPANNLAALVFLTIADRHFGNMDLEADMEEEDLRGARRLASHVLQWNGLELKPDANGVCPCGSGFKFDECCGAEECQELSWLKTKKVEDCGKLPWATIDEYSEIMKYHNNIIYRSTDYFRRMRAICNKFTDWDFASIAMIKNQKRIQRYELQLNALQKSPLSCRIIEKETVDKLNAQSGYHTLVFYAHDVFLNHGCAQPIICYHQKKLLRIPVIIYPVSGSNDFTSVAHETFHTLQYFSEEKIIKQLNSNYEDPNIRLYESRFAREIEAYFITTFGIDRFPNELYAEKIWDLILKSATMYLPKEYMETENIRIKTEQKRELWIKACEYLYQYFITENVTRELKKIISDGQPGAPKASLDAATACGLEHGGSIPKGRLTEIGPLDIKCDKIDELPSSDDSVVMEKNVAESDATIIFTAGPLNDKLEMTKNYADELNKPFDIFDFHDHGIEFPNIEYLYPPGIMIKDICAWINEVEPVVLNIAGLSEEEAPGIQKFVFDTLMEVIKNLNLIAMQSFHKS